MKLLHYDREKEQIAVQLPPRVTTFKFQTSSYDKSIEIIELPMPYLVFYYMAYPWGRHYIYSLFFSNEDVESFDSLRMAPLPNVSYKEEPFLCLGNTFYEFGKFKQGLNSFFFRPFIKDYSCSSSNLIKETKLRSYSNWRKTSLQDALKVDWPKFSKDQFNSYKSMCPLGKIDDPSILERL